MRRPKSTPGPPRRTLRFKSVPTTNQSQNSSFMSQSQGSTRDPLAAVNPRRPLRRQNRHHSATTSAFSLGATLASLSILPRRSLLGQNRHHGWGIGHRQATSLSTSFDFQFGGTHDDPYFQELAASAPQRRNWRGILIGNHVSLIFVKVIVLAFSMIVFISSIILAIIFFISPRKSLY